VVGTRVNTVFENDYAELAAAIIGNGRVPIGRGNNTKIAGGGRAYPPPRKFVKFVTIILQLCPNRVYRRFAKVVKYLRNNIIPFNRISDLNVCTCVCVWYIYIRRLSFSY